MTSSFWNAQKLWYLNVNVYGTSAHEGTMGKLAPAAKESNWDKGGTGAGECAPFR